MTLISILVGLTLEYFLGALDQIRNFVWFDQYSKWLELRCNSYAIWNGPVGVLITLAIPVIVLLIIAYWLGKITVILPFLLAIFIFVYSLGPEMNNLIDNYIAALADDDDEQLQKYGKLLFNDDEEMAMDEMTVIQSILVRSHEYIFGILFWFIILGMTGALLYSLLVRLGTRFSGIHGGYADAIRDLHNIMMWPSARLQALGFALSGSLVDALEGWRTVSGDHTLDFNAEVIGKCGLGAIQFMPPTADDEDLNAGSTGCLQEAQGLINRTLIVWLTVLGIMTIGGWLS